MCKMKRLNLWSVLVSLLFFAGTVKASGVVWTVTDNTVIDAKNMNLGKVEGSFGWAVKNASNGDTIRIQTDALPDGRIQLNGWIRISKSLYIDGNGVVIYSANAMMNHAINVNAGAEGLTEFADVRFDACGVLVEAPSTYRRCVFRNFFGAPMNVQMYAQFADSGHPVLIENCLFTGNAKGQNFGVVYCNTAIGFEGSYGVDIVSSAFIGNTTVGDASHASVVDAYSSAAQVRLFNNVFQDNTGDGGDVVMGGVTSCGYNLIEGAVAEGITLDANDKSGTDLGDLLVWNGDVLKVNADGDAYGNLPANVQPEDGIALPEQDLYGNPIDYTVATHSGASQEVYRQPVVWTVVSDASEGEGTFFEAMSSATDGDIIRFDASLNGKAIDLGEREINISGKSLTIEGNPGCDKVTLKGGLYSFTLAGCKLSDLVFDSYNGFDVSNSDLQAERCVFQSYSQEEGRRAPFYCVNNNEAGDRQFRVLFSACRFSRNIGRQSGAFYIQNDFKQADGTASEQNAGYYFVSCTFVENGVSNLVGAWDFVLNQNPALYLANCAFEVGSGAAQGHILGAYEELCGNARRDETNLGVREIVKYEDGEYLVRPGELAYGKLSPNPEKSVTEVVFPEKDILGNVIDYTQATHAGACQTVAESKAVDGVLLVTTAEPTGEGSLGQALYDAFDGETIRIDPSLEDEVIVVEAGDWKHNCLFPYAYGYTIEGNGAVIDGGGLLSFQLSHAKEITDLAMRNFKHVYMQDNDVCFRRCVFDTNHDMDRTGAVEVFFSHSGSHEVNFESCLFTNLSTRGQSGWNTAAGGLWVHQVPQVSTGKVNVVSCTFVNNTLKVEAGDGAGNDVAVSNSPQVRLFNCVFSSPGEVEGMHAIGGKAQSAGYNVVEGTVSPLATLQPTDAVVDGHGATLLCEDGIWGVNAGGRACGHLPTNVQVEGITLPEQDLYGHAIDYTASTHSGASQVVYDPTSIDEVAPAMQAYVTGDGILVAEGCEGVRFFVYATDGRLLKQLEATGDGCRLHLDLPKGTYIIKGVNGTEAFSTIAIVY